jgi:hypothetical protein
MLQLILCLLGKHRPNRKRLRSYRGDFFGPCVGCRKRMFRSAHGWRLARSGDGTRPADQDPQGRRRGMSSDHSHA